MNIRAKSAFVILASIGLIVAVFVIPLPRSAALDTRIVTSTAIDRPPAVVFDFVTTPGHWPAWHPSSLSVSGQTDHPLNVGEKVTESFRVAGRRGVVVWTVRQRDPPRKWSIDGEIDGKFAGTVTYRLAPDASGTRFTREFTYRAPSLWFALINGIVLRKKIQSESDEAVARLKQLLESTLRQ
jgi:uncharacterized protein YndB with AHSA1/START domain